jgi:ribosome-associated toxin RatA of RatAB toxin-antitoxin module
MASAKTTHFFDCTAEELFYIITDYENYPEFLPEVKDCTIVKDLGDRKLVEYQISLIKSFNYRLWMNEDWDTKKVTWEFNSGDLFKQSTGSWILEDVDGRCKATYEVDAKVKMFVPGAITKKLVSVNLPSMMKAYEKRLTEVTYE